MQLIPTLDLSCGQAVHGRSGNRAAYQPVDSILTPGLRGDALSLARAYRRELGAARCYVADLDAITGHALQRELLRQLVDYSTGFGPGLVVDAGAWSAVGARELIDLGISEIVVGLETLRSFADLGRITAEVGTERVIFSLDLQDGALVLGPALREQLRRATPAHVARRARDSNVGALLLLDVGRVGTGRGIDRGLVAELRCTVPELALWVGGGIRSEEELESLTGTGCEAALVGTAIHAGAIGRQR